MNNRVCIITGTRAEFGLLEPLIRRFLNDSEIDLQLVVTGSHLSEKFGNTQDEIEKAGIPIYKRIRIDLDGDSKEDMAISTGETVSAFAHYYEEEKPDIVVVLGDRYEIFAAVSAASVMCIPIAHIHGGEITEGAVDDSLRHAITKMSYLHFTACETYRKRVIQMGESPDRVYNVGALGVENIKRLEQIDRPKLENYLGINLDSNYALVTYHPVTTDTKETEKEFNSLVSVMKKHSDMKFIITMSNADAGGRTINELWKSETLNHKNWRLVSSLGSKRFLSLLANAKMMIGNSSSGILEAPSFGIPTVNIGDRQKGRMMASSIICCSSEKEDIEKAVKTALSDSIIEKIKGTENPFGDGETSVKIYEIVKCFLNNETTGIRKHFYDINF